MLHLFAKASEMRSEKELAVDAGRPSNDAAVEKVADAANAWVIAPVLDHSVDEPGLSGGGDDRARLFESSGKRLFGQQVTAATDEPCRYQELGGFHSRQ